MLLKTLDVQVESVEKQQQELVKVRHSLIRERGRIRKRLTQMKERKPRAIA